MYKFTPPPIEKEERKPPVTLSLPGDTDIPVPAGQWRKVDGRIVATYSRAELWPALFLAFDKKRRELEDRLERGLQLMSEVSADDDARAERLLTHWEVLNEEYTQVQGMLSLCRTAGEREGIGQ